MAIFLDNNNNVYTSKPDDPPVEVFGLAGR